MRRLVFRGTNRDSIVRARAAIGELYGVDQVFQVTIDEYDSRRNNEQNALWWTGYVEPFHRWLVDQGNDHFTKLHAHEILKKMFLTEVAQDENGAPLIDPITNEPLEYVRGTSKLGKREFSTLLDRVGAFFSNDLGLSDYGSNKDPYRNYEIPE